MALEEHDPRVFLFEPTGPSAKPNSIVINTQTMQPGEEQIVVEALREVIGSALSTLSKRKYLSNRSVEVTANAGE